MAKKLKFLWVIAAALAVAIPLAAATSRAETIEWQSYENAQQSRLDRKQLLYFWAEWCGYCRNLEKKAFQDPEIVAYINHHFLPVRINIDKEKQIAAHFSISGVPALQFMSPKGEAIARWPGYIEAKDLLPLLKYIYSDSYLKEDYAQFLKKNS